ncbi:MAG: 7-cyano-7-deazaguanine synthase [Planctomycetota bacterium]
MSSPGALLVDRGDLPSLVAVTLEAGPQHLALYHPLESDPAAARRRAAAEEHGAVFDIRQVVVEPLGPLDAAGGDADPPQTAEWPGGLDQAWVLLRAAAVARKLARPRIIWPHQVGPDAGAVGLAVERASLVSALVEISGGQQAGAEMVIDLPLVDLTDAQLVDLAEDAGAPMHAFWPCAGAGGLPCETCAGCRRWQAAFAEAGVAWPWVPATV